MADRSSISRSLGEAEGGWLRRCRRLAGPRISYLWLACDCQLNCDDAVGLEGTLRAMGFEPGNRAGLALQGLQETHEGDTLQPR
jgi:hypothetical protein